jgi:diguanylate cyclase (GGDEF)-like protein
MAIAPPRPLRPSQIGLSLADEDDVNDDTHPLHGQEAEVASLFAVALLDALPDATAVLDRAGTIVAVNLAWRMFALDNGGTPEATGVGVSYLNVCERSAAAGCTDAAEVLVGLRAVLAGATVESDREYPCPSPAVGRWFTSRITTIRAPTGGALASHVNISRRRQSERDLVHRASHDPLTGLANRLLFAEKLADALKPRAGRASTADVGLLYIDLDDFKLVNDRFGHDAGDEVLLNVANRLRGQVRPQDTVARLGGDEFAVCAPRITPDGAAGLAARIDAALGQPLQVHGTQLTTSGSVGVHLVAPGDSAAEALDLADRAMYVVKNGRAGRISRHV